MDARSTTRRTHRHVGSLRSRCRGAARAAVGVPLVCAAATPLSPVPASADAPVTVVDAIAVVPGSVTYVAST